MSVWRLEWLRLWRTHRLVVLVATFLLLGLSGPVLAYFLPDLLRQAARQEGFAIEAPQPVPADGFAQLTGNASQIGLLVVAVVAALALASDARSGLAAFLRTRVPSALRRLLPAYLVTTAAVLAAWTLGMLGAWYETVVLLGPVAAGNVLLGWVTWVAYLAFTVALAALGGAVVRSVPAVAGLVVGALIGVGLLGLVPALGDWLPSALVSAPADLVRGDAAAADYVAPVAVTLAATVAALAAAVALANRREL